MPNRVRTARSRGWNLAVASLTALLLILLARQGGAAGSQLRVAIDAGHSPAHAGAISASGRGEYWYNKDIAFRLRVRLRERGIAAFIVAERDPELSLSERVESSQRGRANLLVSIHHDSVQPRYLVETIGPAGERLRQSDHARGFSLFLALGGDSSSGSLHVARLIGERLVAAGVQPTSHHAESIPGEGRELLQPELGLYRNDRLVLLRKAGVPAVLIECGVIVHPEEEKLLRSEPHQRLIVDAIAAAISDYSTASTPTPGPASPTTAPHRDANL